MLELVDTDVGIGPAGVKVVTSLVPCKGGATEVLFGLLVDVVLVDGGSGNSLKEGTGREVKNLDASLGTDNEPVELLGEEDDVHGGLAVGGGKELSVNEIPDHDGTVTGAGGEVGGVLDHIDGVDLSLVAGEGVHEGHVEVVPDLDALIPGGGDNDGVLLSVVELDAGNGIGVLVLVDGVSAVTLGVPHLDLVVETTGHELSIVSGDGDGEDILVVANELLDGLASGDVPEADGAVPGGGHDVTGVGSHADFTDEVGVTY